MAPIELWSVVRRVRAAVSGDIAAALARRTQSPVAGPDPAVHQATGAAPLGGLHWSVFDGVGLTPRDAVAAAAQTTPGGRPVLTSRRLARAADALAALSPGDAGRLRALLADISPVLRAYLLVTLAAGHLPVRVEKLAADIRPYARDDGWLHGHLGLLHGGIGPATYADDAGGVLPLRQLAPVTCGPTSLIVLRALVDPVYALQLTTGGDPGDPARSGVRAVEERFRAEQGAVHHAATRGAVGPLPWPKALGTPPWGAARFLNRLSWVTGVEYSWQPVDTADPEHLRKRLVAITGGLALGVPVPLYIGKQVDRHVVLAFGHAGRRLRVYDPSGAEVVDVAEDDLLANRLGIAGWDRLEGVLTPRAV